jgi:hypothetical protein
MELVTASAAVVPEATGSSKALQKLKMVAKNFIRAKTLHD